MGSNSSKSAPQAAPQVPPVSAAEKRGQFQRMMARIKAKERADGFGVMSTRAIFAAVIDPSATKESLSDVTLTCQGKSFNCHRVILSQMSTTFHRMFTGDFAEGNKMAVVIEDITSNTMLELLRFIYCGYVETDVAGAPCEVQHEILYAAVKYDLWSLVEYLLIAFEENLNAETACRFLIWADRFGLEQLKNACFAVMAWRSNTDAVLASPEWQQVAGNKQLTTEYYRFSARY